MLTQFVDNARSADSFNHSKIRNYIDNVAEPGHPKFKDIAVNLECLEPVLKICLGDRELEPHLITALAKLRVRSTNRVDQMMSLFDIPAQLQEKIKTRSPDEEMAVATVDRLVYFVRNAILLKPNTQLANLFLTWFKCAPDCNSLAEWVSQGLGRVLNGLCADDLFKF